MSIPAAVERMVRQRSRGVCEACGRRDATEMHHRQYRSRLGKDVASNLLHVCGWGNHTGCHGVAHTKAGHELGLSVHSWDEPTEVAVQHARLGRVLLDDAGGWVDAATRVSVPADTPAPESPISTATKVANDSEWS